MYKVSYYSTYYTLCVYRYACVYACMTIRRLVHAYYPTFNPPILHVRVCDTQIHTHTHIHTLKCRQMQAFNRPFVTRTYTCIHLHAHAHTYTHATHASTRLLEKGIRIWKGMVLCIRPCLAMSIHRGTLAYIHWGI